ncbi:MAG: FAD-dependent oxidoreductase, partial [Pseudomonadota bacterium]
MIGAPTPGGPPSRCVEVAVIGAGPAGRAAALVLARAGANVLLLDKAAIAPPLNALSEEAVSANTLVWSVLRTPTGFRLDLLSPAGPDAVEARVVLAAIGAVERVVPFPGWRLPGVLELSATAAALRKGQPPPGNRVVVAGAGPSPHALALDIRQAGAKIA